MIRRELNRIYKNDVPMVEFSTINGISVTRRLPACTIGVWFEILTWMMENGYDAR